MNASLEQQIDNLISTLKKTNDIQAREGARQIPESEYRELKTILMKKVIRS